MFESLLALWRTSCTYFNLRSTGTLGAEYVSLGGYGVKEEDFKEKTFNFLNMRSVHLSKHRDSKYDIIGN